MTEGRRPGGLTALAVINFVLVGLSVMQVLGMAALFAFADTIVTPQMDAKQRAQIEAVQNMGTPLLVFLVALTLATAVLLLLSGIGYLRQKKFLGRILGNVYAAVAIIGSLASGMMFAAELGGGFNLGTILGLIYPVLTLILVNTTFKDDLTN